MTVQYNITSPYYGTPQSSWHLGYWQGTRLTKSEDDDLYRIPNEYNFRPDRLAHKLYGNSGLWWIFAVVNPDVIKDPIWDFKAGTVISIPTARRIETFLGAS